MNRRVHEQGAIRNLSAYFSVGSTPHPNSKSAYSFYSLPQSRLVFSRVQESLSSHVGMQRAWGTSWPLAIPLPKSLWVIHDVLKSSNPTDFHKPGRKKVLLSYRDHQQEAAYRKGKNDERERRGAEVSRTIFHLDLLPYPVCFSTFWIPRYLRKISLAIWNFRGLKFLFF